MTKKPKDETGSSEKTGDNAGKSSGRAAMAASAIGSAAIAAALLYIGQRSRKKSADEPSKRTPRDENPETD